jgi:phosphinothricin acetyltransferase
MASGHGLRVRDGSPEDGAACAAVYEPYVIDTAITFETEPPSAEQMATRIARSLRTHAWLVLEEDGRVLGFAYGAPFHQRAAYRWSSEVSVYLAAGSRGRGGGRMLYEALLPRLAQRGFRLALAGMTMPNAASEALHRGMGFEPVGTFRRVGYKHGRWHDVAWTQRSLVDDDGQEPGEPV